MFLTGLQLVCPGCCPEKFFSRTVAWRAKETVLARKGGDSGQKNETIFLEEQGVGKKKIIIIYFALISYKNMEAWALCVLWALPWGLLPPVRALGWGQTHRAWTRAFSPTAWRVALALTQPSRAETIAGGPAQIPRPGLGHRKEAFSGKGKRLPDHSLGFERPKLV